MNDPTVALALIRDHIRRTTGGEALDPRALASLVTSLDLWITAGGYLPAQWNDVVSHYTKGKAA